MVGHIRGSSSWDIAHATSPDFRKSNVAITSIYDYFLLFQVTKTYDYTAEKDIVFLLLFFHNNCNIRLIDIYEGPIRNIPDHATFRVKVHTLGLLDKLWGFLSLALCNQANFDEL